MGMMDLHMHSTVSDGTDRPEELLDVVQRAGIAIFSLTDHDALKGCSVIRQLLENPDSKTSPGDQPFKCEDKSGDDLRFIAGVEFSCKDEKGKYHILGYGYDPESAAIRAVVEKGHRYRMEKTRARLDGLEKKYGIVFPPEETGALLAMDNPGKPHIGNLMVRCGYAQTKEEAICKYIDRLHVKSRTIRPEEAIAGILGSGGIPVLAHPYFGSGSERLDSGEMEERLKRLCSLGLQGTEAFYSGFAPELVREMQGFARRYDLYVTAGSDYHGRNKRVRPGQTGLAPGEPLPEGVQRFLEAVGIL